MSEPLHVTVREEARERESFYRDDAEDSELEMVQDYYYDTAKLLGYGAKGKPRSRSEARGKAIVRGGARLARLKWGG